MKRQILLLIVLILLQSALVADIMDWYSFQNTTGTYEAISGTAIPSAVGDDVLSDLIDIGFSFQYGAQSYSQIRISSNGCIALGNYPTTIYYNNLASIAVCPVLAPLWDDLNTVDGSVQYLLSGTAPERILTVQYANTRWNYISLTHFNFQVKLYENSRIDFCYGPAMGTPYNPSASIGINMQPGGGNNFLSVTPGTAANVSYMTENDAIASFPGNGCIYTFNPLEPVSNDLGALSITGNPTPSVDVVSVYQITVRNYGTQAQNNYTVSLMSGNDVLGTATGLAVLPGQTVNVVLSWIPETPGPMIIYGKVTLAGDARPWNDDTPNFQLVVQPGGVIIDPPITHLARYPLDFYFKNSLCETIYTQWDLPWAGIETGTITQVSLYNNSVSILVNKPVKIWMGSTQAANLSEGWIPATQLQLVFDGVVSLPSGENTIIIPLQNPFDFASGNLVIMFQRPWDPIYYNSNDRFHCYYGGANQTRMIYSDNVVYDPASPPGAGGFLNNEIPRITLSSIPVQVGALSGTVTDTSDNPLEGATIQALNYPPVQTDVAGHYYIPVIAAGTHDFTISRHGFFTQWHTVQVIADTTVVHDFVLTPLPTVSVSGTVISNGIWDQPMENALVRLQGYEIYSVNTDSTGSFTMPSVYANNFYDVIVTAPGYEPAYSVVTLQNEDIVLNPISLNQYLLPPNDAAAQFSADSTSVFINWSPPDSLAVCSGYRIWRLHQGDEEIMSNWIMLAYLDAAETTFTDDGWDSLDAGSYRWAVNACYLSPLESEPILSNILVKEHTHIDENVVPSVTALLGNYPNPFGNLTTIRYSIAKSDEIYLKIYNAKGQLVRTLVSEKLIAGHYSITWDGRDEQYRKVSNGIYYYSLQVGQKSVIKKLIYLSE